MDVFATPKIMQRPTFKQPRVREPKAELAKAIPLPADEHLPLEIQGQAVGSKEEGRASMALDMMGLRYIYQYVVNYGRQRRGGQILDFLIISFKPRIILDVRGAYWHTGIHEDSLWVEQVSQQRHWPLRILWDYEATSVDAALSKLRAILPHA